MSTATKAQSGAAHRRSPLYTHQRMPTNILSIDGTGESRDQHHHTPSSMTANSRRNVNGPTHCVTRMPKNGPTVIARSCFHDTVCTRSTTVASGTVLRISLTAAHCDAVIVSASTLVTMTSAVETAVSFLVVTCVNAS